MDYEKKYKEITEGFFSCAEDVSDLYPDCNYFEKCILALRKANWTFGNIQKALGMPPKKSISNTLKQWAPELIDNSKQKTITVSKWESELYGILKKYKKDEFYICGDLLCFRINNDHNVEYIDEVGKTWLFNCWSEVEQQQMLNEIKDQINEC